MMSLGVTRLSASPSASSSRAFVLVSARPSDFVTCESISSIGVESGRYGGSGSTRAPTPSIAFATPAVQWGLRLSKTPTSRVYASKWQE